MGFKPIWIQFSSRPPQAQLQRFAARQQQPQGAVIRDGALPAIDGQPNQGEGAAQAARYEPAAQPGLAAALDLRPECELGSQAEQRRPSQGQDEEVQEVVE